MGLLSRVDFDVYVTPAEFWDGNVAWPPERVRRRDERFQALDLLYLGDFSEHLTNQQVPVNVFGDHSTRLADLMLMAEPSGPSTDVGLDEALYDAVIDWSVFGGAVFIWDGAVLEAADPPTWYPVHDGDDGGDMFFTRMVSDSARGAEADRVRIRWISENGGALERVFSWTEGRIGAVLDETVLPTSAVARAPADPTNGIWGTSEYQRLCGAGVEIVRRMSKNSYILDLFSAPSVTYSSTLDDARGRFNIPDDDDDETAERKIREQIGKDFEGSIIRIDEPCLLDAKFFQPETSGVVNALAQVDALREFIGDATGMPDMAGMTAPPSGEALKRLYLPWYARTRRMQIRMSKVVGELLGGNIRWDHVFDTLEGEVPDGSDRPVRVVMQNG